VPDGKKVAYPEAPISRRRLTSLIVGGALLGASWTAGLAVVARGRHPQVFVLGRDNWQVLLVEHGGNRIVFLAGTFERSPEAEIDLLCGLLRQHIDVVAGDRNVLGLLSSGFRARRSVETIIDLDGSPQAANSQRFVSISNPIGIQAGALNLEIVPLARGLWQGEVSNGSGWIVHITIGDVVIAVARTLDPSVIGNGIERAGHSNDHVADCDMNDPARAVGHFALPQTSR